MEDLNRKGFTLVELLAVIVLMTVLITVAVPGVMRVGNSLKVQSFCSKINIIESAALEYADDYYVGKETTNETVLDNVSVMDLVNMGYLKADNDIKTLADLTSDELKDKQNGKKFCILYDKTSNCVVDPRDDSPMDYKLVKIWTINKRIYASFLYNTNDTRSQVCGNTINYKTENTTTNFPNPVNVTNLGSFTVALKPTKVMENTKFGWTNYKTYRITRPSNIPGNYYISNVSIKYEVGSNTKMEINIGEYQKRNNLISSGTLSLDLNGKYLSNLDVSYRVALRGSIRDSNAYGKVTAINVTWTSLS